MNKDNKIAQAEFAFRQVHARNLVRSVGHILSLFPSAIRAITSASSILKTEDKSKINKFAVNSAYSTINLSPTLSAAFQSAASELYPHEYKNLSENGIPAMRDVLCLMSANEISAILGLTYFYKLLNKICDQSEFEKISPLISVYLKNAAVVGAQMSDNFGRGGAIAAAGLRMLGLACLIKANLKGFKVLRRQIDDSASLNNSEIELAHFNCTHLDVASVIAGDLGYGQTAREALLLLESGSAEISNPKIICWIHTLKEAEKIWKEKVSQNSKDPRKKAALGSLDSTDGYKWLWKDAAVTKEAEQETPTKGPGVSRAPRMPKDIAIASANGQLRIMLVEDDSTSSKILEKIVHSLGTVSSFANAETAEEALISDEMTMDFDCIFLDVGLPGKSGIYLLNQIRQLETQLQIPEDKSPIILMLTGDESAETVVKAFSEGADGYLTKPFKKSDIAEELKKYGIILSEQA